MQKMCLKIADIDNFWTHFCHFWVPYRPSSGNFSSDSCRGGAKLQNEYSNIKIRQEITSEMRKM